LYASFARFIESRKLSLFWTESIPACSPRDPTSHKLFNGNVNGNEERSASNEIAQQ
jgi:hypothetical protein